MNYTICYECETVAHCSKNGCIPKQPYTGPKPYNPESDVRELGKWLNEEPNRPLDRTALARVLAYLQGYTR